LRYLLELARRRLGLLISEFWTCQWWILVHIFLQRSVKWSETVKDKLCSAAKLLNKVSALVTWSSTDFVGIRWCNWRWSVNIRILDMPVVNIGTGANLYTALDKCLR
jgi:hypothetical protein